MDEDEVGGNTGRWSSEEMLESHPHLTQVVSGKSPVSHCRDAAEDAA